MKKEEINLSDWTRILLGEAPPIFLLEVLIRSIITYVLLLIVVSWLGKRMSGQLTIMEMAVMLTLGAIVSVPMQTPDRGVLQGLTLLLCAVGFQRGISYIGFRSHKFENITRGKPNILVNDGLIDLEQMVANRISRQQLFSVLRGQKIFNLGAVERVYLEACDLLSVYPAAKPQYGLPIYPPDDAQDRNGEMTSAEKAGDYKACVNCGNVTKENQHSPCRICGENSFTHAII
ncbi:DUF421 domain-containing protein [Mucilaginibacter pallidiroseus]|uniref:DUF421 domain-containing protein n=1 Tax=Mucilaginibacter pallidiroseus TaxID=2599295 RepID=A0A563UHR4_9SPHI|nr:YetF domain-containing protein [Mucilaginibacter pallidiroseus]TWR30924.1 DUF421 domain-containing protein [Mucilaginibacter pallidiroseus]